MFIRHGAGATSSARRRSPLPVLPRDSSRKAPGAPDGSELPVAGALGAAPFVTHNELVTEACCQLWHTDPQTRVRAANRLAQLKDRSAIDQLKMAWDREGDDETQRLLGNALSELIHDRTRHD